MADIEQIPGLGMTITINLGFFENGGVSFGIDAHKFQFRAEGGILLPAPLEVGTNSLEVASSLNVAMQNVLQSAMAEANKKPGSTLLVP